MLTNEFLTEIKKLISDHAEAALTNPKEGDRAFEFGKACGYMQGLKQALQIFETILDQDDKDHGRKRRGAL